MSTAPDCVFCHIIAGKQTPHDYHNYGPVVRFEPLNPVVPGHRLFVPVVHAANVAENSTLAGIAAEFAASYAAGLYSDFNLIVNNGAAASQTVPHMHWHVVPRRDGDGLTLPWTGQQTGGTQ